MKSFLLFFSFFLGLNVTVSAQLSKYESSNNEEYLEKYSFLADQPGVYTVTIVSPSGEVQTVPVVKKELGASGKIDFQFNRKWWKAGMYQINIENENGFIFTKEVKFSQGY